MALAPLVTVDDFEGWIGSPIAAEDQDRAARYLVAVSSLVRSEAGQTWEGIDVPDVVQTVTLWVAKRVWQNPEGAVSYSLTTGAVGKSVTFPNPKAVGLYLTSEEKALIGGTRANQRGLWTMATTRNDPYADTVWVPVVGTEALFPFLTTDDL